MKQLTILLFFILLSLTTLAQHPVKWSYITTKVDSNSYQIQVNATIKPGWHIYANKQPKSFIGVPTNIKFDNNPIIKLIGFVKENGKLKKKKDPDLEIEQYQYEGKVSFTQKLTLLKTGKIALTGTVTWQACTDKECLMEQNERFNLILE